MNSAQARTIIILLIVVVVFLLVSVFLQLAATSVGGNASALPVWLERWTEAWDKDPWRSVWYVAGAMIIGALGAWAFHLGVVTGFISRADRDKVLQFMLNQPGLTFCFWLTGGIVAGVFQMAQLTAFAPVQAFVLGATWPSVVTRIMSGGGGPPLTNPADVPPGQVPTPTGASAAAVERG